MTPVLVIETRRLRGKKIRGSTVDKSVQRSSAENVLNETDVELAIS